MCVRQYLEKENEKFGTNKRKLSLDDTKVKAAIADLKMWAMVCAGLHLALAFIAFSLYAFESFRNYGTYLVRYIVHNDGWYEPTDVLYWNLTIGCGFFALLSSVFHLLTLTSWKQYIAMLKIDYDEEFDKGRFAGANIYRWIEYSLSAAVMNVNIAVICSVKDINSIILIAALTALVMPYGLTLEVMRKSVYYQYVLWSSWIFYTLGGLTFWVTLLSYDDLGTIPAVAWTVLAALTFLFNVFGAWNLAVNYVDVITYEKGYYLLSVISKTLLFLLVVWGGISGGDWLDRKFTCTNPKSLITPTVTKTITPSMTYTYTDTPTHSKSNTRTPSYTSTLSVTPSSTVTSSISPSPTPSATMTP